MNPFPFPMEPFPFQLPDEVIWELANPDAVFEDEYNFFDRDERAAPARDGAVCEQCGYDDLEWTDTKHGPRLVYASGPLKGKIHECDV